MLERKKYPGKNRGNEHSDEHSRAVFHEIIGTGAKRVGKYLGLFLLLFSGPCLAITEAQFIQKVLAQDKLLEEAQIGLDIKQIELDASRDNYQNWKATISSIPVITTGTETATPIQQATTPAKAGSIRKSLAWILTNGFYPTPAACNWASAEARNTARKKKRMSRQRHRRVRVVAIYSSTIMCGNTKPITIFSSGILC